MEQKNKKYLYLAIGVLFIVVIGSVYSFFYDIGGKALEIEGESVLEVSEFTTDKETYSSQEEMIVDLEIISSENINSAKIELKGIKPYNKNYIDSSKTIDLEKGKNQITFKEETPYCTSGCGGVYPGPYGLIVKIYSGEDLIINSTKTIELTNH